MSQTTDQILQSGLEDLGLVYDSTQFEQTLNYLDLLQKWNSKFNLVADTDKKSMVSRHVLDSLSIKKHITGGHVLDIGSGAGLPGIPLAIFGPQQKFTLMDSNGKKTRFLFQVKTALNLSNVVIENSRVESYQCSHQIDMVTCRAFATLAEIVSKAKHLLPQECKLMAMKGRFPFDEIENLPEEFVVLDSVKLKVPGLAADRYLVSIAKN